MGHIRRQAKGSKEIDSFIEQRDGLSHRATVGLSRSGRGPGQPERDPGVQAAGSWQGAGQRSAAQRRAARAGKGRHMDVWPGVGEVGGPLKLQTGVHPACRGPSCLGGVACARGCSIEISPSSARETWTSRGAIAPARRLGHPVSIRSTQDCLAVYSCSCDGTVEAIWSCHEYILQTLITIP